MIDDSPNGRDIRPRYDEEIRLVATIVERADRTVRPKPVLLITVGTLGCAMDLCYFLYYRCYYEIAPEHAPTALLVAAHLFGTALFIGAVWGLLARPAVTRWTAVDRQLAATFSVAVATALLVDSLDWPRWVMTGPDYAMLWNALLVIPMLSIGLQYANRTLIAGGFVLAASLVAPRVDPWRIDLYLALGMFLGCAVPGIIFGLRRRG